MSKYKTILGALVRDFILIKYMKWTGKEDDPWKVPESEKDIIWERRIPEYFTFPEEYDKDLVKEKAYEIMGACFKTFKGFLQKRFILENKEPDFDGGEFNKQRNFWQDFKEYRLSDEYLELSRKNKENSQKNENPHCLGSRGYAKKMVLFQAELDKMEELAAKGKEVQTAEWEPRSLLYCMARGVRHAKDGSFSSENQPMSDLIQRISHVTEEVKQGSHTSNRENDVLTQALGNKEHPGHTRGTGVVPWKLAFPEESRTYRCRSRGRAEQEAEYLRRLKEMEDTMDARIEA